MKFPPLLLLLLCLALPVLAKDPILPDPKLTPGDILPGVPVETIATPGYANGGAHVAAGARNVPESEKRQVFIAYFGAVPANPGAYEIDHCISIELGGSNSPRNLWPQSYSGLWNARVKDRLEDWLAADVRATLKAAGHAAATAKLARYQSEISGNWTNAYVRYLGDPARAGIKHGRPTE